VVGQKRSFKQHCSSEVDQGAEPRGGEYRPEQIQVRRVGVGVSGMDASAVPSRPAERYTNSGAAWCSKASTGST